jgi:hypothetical protein
MIIVNQKYIISDFHFILFDEGLIDVFNTYPFIFKRKENMLELLEAVLMALIIFSDEIIKKQFGLFELNFLIICSLIIYRNLFYNLSKRSNNSNI